MQIATTFTVQDLKNLSFENFTSSLFNTYYPYIFEELKTLEQNCNQLNIEYDIEVLESCIKRISTEFETMYQKEKLVLFPFLKKLNDEHKKAENCNAFKNTKQHHTTILNTIENSTQALGNVFINENNQEIINILQQTLQLLKNEFETLQFIKDGNYYIHFKQCDGCKPLHEKAS